MNSVLVRVDPASPEAIYAQIAGAVRREVAAGRVRPGERLPGARELAAALGVNLHTVLRGYQELRDEGVVELRRGRGAVVTDAAPRIAGPLLSLRAFVAEARRAGLTAAEAAAMVRGGDVMRRTAALIVGVPVLVGVLGVVVLLTIRSSLPDPVATHWDNSGPDGFTSRSWAVLPVLVGAVLGLFLGGIAGWYGRREPAARRLAAGLAAGTSVFVTGIAVGSLWEQRGLASAADAPGIGGVLVVALLAGLLAGAAAALAVPGEPAAVATGPVAGARLPLAPGEQAAWSAWAGAPPAVVALAAVTLLPIVVLVALGIAPVFLVLVLVLVLALLGATLSARVWVDRRGLTVRSPFGWPAYTVALGEIAAVQVVEVSPLRDYGGWGWRLGRRGRPGVVFRAGPALSVTRGDGRRFVVTVDGAGEAAALLTTLTDRVRG